MAAGDEEDTRKRSEDGACGTETPLSTEACPRHTPRCADSGNGSAWTRQESGLRPTPDRQCGLRISPRMGCGPLGPSAAEPLASSVAQRPGSPRPRRERPPEGPAPAGFPQPQAPGVCLGEIKLLFTLPSVFRGVLSTDIWMPGPFG